MLASELYEIAENKNISIICFPMPESKSMSLSTESGDVIGMDNSKYYSSSEECVLLGHELGHCLYGGFYSHSSSFGIVAQHERRADRWFIRNFIPWEELSFWLSQCYSSDEIAEKMNITEEYVRKAYYFYKESY